MRVPYHIVLLLVWGAVVLFLTLSPSAWATGDTPLDPLCLVCGERGAADALLNLLLFAPIGWALQPRLGLWGALMAGAALSLGIEVAQTAIPGRYPTIGDLAFNASGAAVGALLHGKVRRLPVWVAGLSLVGLAAPLILLAPVPTGGVYYGQWTARLGHLESYEGRLLAARIGEVAVPEGARPDSPALRERVADREPLRVEFEVGPVPAGLAPVFSVFDDAQQQIVLLGVDGTDLVYRGRPRATTLRLDSPELRWPRALAAYARGDTVRVSVDWARSSPCMSLDGRTQCDVAPGFGSGWTLLLYPLPLGPRWNGFADLVWVGLLALPLGWVIRRTGPALACGVGLAGLLLALSWVAPDTAMTWPVLAPLVGGAGLGAVLRRRTT